MLNTIRYELEDDKVIEAKYDINTLCAMSDDGIDVLDLDNVKFSIPFTRKLLYHGLKRVDKRVTINMTGEYMSTIIAEGKTFDQLSADIFKCLYASLGVDMDKVEDAKEETIETENEEGK